MQDIELLAPQDSRACCQIYAVVRVEDPICFWALQNANTAASYIDANVNRIAADQLDYVAAGDEGLKGRATHLADHQEGCANSAENAPVGSAQEDNGVQGTSVEAQSPLAFPRVPTNFRGDGPAPHRGQTLPKIP